MTKLRPDLSGAHFFVWLRSKSPGKKERERRAEIGAQIKIDAVIVSQPKNILHLLKLNFAS